MTFQELTMLEQPQAELISRFFRQAENRLKKSPPFELANFSYQGKFENYIYLFLIFRTLCKEKIENQTSLGPVLSTRSKRQIKLPSKLSSR